MRVLNRRFHADSARQRTAPAYGGRERWRWVHRHAMRLHVAGDAHVLVGGISGEIGCSAFAPAIDEGVAGAVRERIGEVTLDFHWAGRTDAKIVQPGRECAGLDP